MPEKPEDANQFFATFPAAMEKIKQIEKHCEQATNHNLQWIEGDSTLVWAITDKIIEDEYSGKFGVIIKVQRMTNGDLVDENRHFTIFEDGTGNSLMPESFKNLD
jgi:hypothetical protein